MLYLPRRAFKHRILAPCEGVRNENVTIAWMAWEVFTLGHRGYSVISQVGVSVATVSNSEEDVYYRIDSMKLWEDCQQVLSAKCRGCVGTYYSR